MEKKLHLIKFIFILLCCSIFLFVVFELAAAKYIEYKYPDFKLTSEENSDFLGHWYSGTFFIPMSKIENFGSDQRYELYEADNIITQDILYYIGCVFLFIFVFSIPFILSRIEKKGIKDKLLPDLIIASGIFYFLYLFTKQMGHILEIKAFNNYSISFIKSMSYYPMAYYIFIIPGIIISIGLVYNHWLKKDKKNNIKYFTYLILFISGVFILSRLGIRVYELIATLTNKAINVRLPFYYMLIELPYYSAISGSAYTQFVLFRFIKDIPLYICGITSIILFIKVLLDCMNNKYNTNENRKRLNIIIIMCIITSIIYNLLGLYEVNLLHNNFLPPYKDAVYTIALRSLCEPIVYALIIYVFKVFLSIIDNKEKR